MTQLNFKITLFACANAHKTPKLILHIKAARKCTAFLTYAA
jgi:hypothetical protein